MQKACQADAVAHAEKDSISSYEVRCDYYYGVCINSFVQSGSVKLSDSRGSALDQCGGTSENTLEKKKRSILKQYERNMKKTHKVSCQKLGVCTIRMFCCFMLFSFLNKPPTVSNERKEV